MKKSLQNNNDRKIDVSIKKRKKETQKKRSKTYRNVTKLREHSQKPWKNTKTYRKVGTIKNPSKIYKLLQKTYKSG